MQNNGWGNYNEKVFPEAKFGMLTVVKRLPREWNPKRKLFLYHVLCKCDCGKTRKINIASMVAGLTKSCGCLNKIKMKERAREKAEKAFAHLIYPGAVLGRLTVIERIEENGKLTERVKCKCSCGNTTYSNIDGLKRGTTKSCGCLASELLKDRNRKNGKFGCFSSDHPETFKIWKSMKNRCYRPKSPGYERYGALGVIICPALRKDPRYLVEMIGERPGPSYSIDRFPICTGDYTCGKCDWCKKNKRSKNIRWATPKEQSNNKSINVFLECFGKKLTKTQWAELAGLSWSTFANRLSRGWDVEKALTTPDRSGHCYDPKLGIGVIIKK